LGRRLYDARKELCELLNLRSIILGGRIPNYHKHSDLSPREYIRRVRDKEIYDPVLSFQLSNNFLPIRVLKNIFRKTNPQRKCGLATMEQYLLQQKTKHNAGQHYSSWIGSVADETF
jgi:hypothetical protein